MHYPHGYLDFSTFYLNLSNFCFRERGFACCSVSDISLFTHHGWQRCKLMEKIQNKTEKTGEFAKEAESALYRVLKEILSQEV